MIVLNGRSFSSQPDPFGRRLGRYVLSRGTQTRPDFVASAVVVCCNCWSMMTDPFNSKTFIFFLALHHPPGDESAYYFLASGGFVQEKKRLLENLEKKSNLRDKNRTLL